MYFRNEIYFVLTNKDLFLKIIVGSIPTMIVGYTLVKYDLIDQLRSIETIGWTTLIFGILLYLSDRYKLKRNISTNFNYKAAIFVGIFQIFSLVPGVSRSGITITAARFLKFKRFDAAKISFLLSIPTLGAVSLFGLKNSFTSEDINISILNLASIFFSYIFSLITINYFLKYIKNFNLNIFVSYRIILGLFLLATAYL